MKTREEVALEVARMCASDRQPLLSTDDILAVVDESQRGVLWEANTVYTTGDLVFPATFNGRLYKVTVAGTTSSTEPDWNTSGRNSLTTDNGVEFLDVGPSYKELYDIKRAAWRGWLMKAERCVELTDASDGSVNVRMSQLYDQCMKAASRYRPMEIV